MDKYNEYRKIYPNFIFNSYEIIDNINNYKIVYNFEIEGLEIFNPTIEISKDIIKDINEIDNYFVFHIGMIELISYWKCTCCPNVIIKADYISEEQLKFFKKLYFHGLGEFFYLNNIDPDYDTFMNIKCIHDEKEMPKIDIKTDGCLIPIGGGKDSNVTLEILKEYNNDYFIINPKEVSIKCANIANNSNNIVTIKRTIDKKLLDLNSKGYLNGHTPFSAYVAFTSYYIAYKTGKKYITLSNENSANESTVLGTKINHQYSKTYEFECDFNNYTNKYFGCDIKYFSFLRPLSELQIAMLFSQYKKYHNIFKSCNVGSKSIPWVWCNECAKCLFVYIILSPFLYKEELINIFNQDLYEKEELLNIFKELIGDAETKPFECVGTTKEVRYAISYLINRLGDNLPCLLKYYKDNYELSDINEPLLKEFNNENNLPQEFVSLLKEELKKCIEEL
ncbi:MAG: hypothetical protein E7170_00245 [Firmicutes bacterium]|nr:hypothetical protein [Bacillota bacterium]